MGGLRKKFGAVDWRQHMELQTCDFGGIRAFCPAVARLFTVFCQSKEPQDDWATLAYPVVSANHHM
jgi:hypothetical protein